MSVTPDQRAKLLLLNEELVRLGREGRLTLDEWAKLLLDAADAAPGHNTEWLESARPPAPASEVDAALRRAALKRRESAAQ